MSKVVIDRAVSCPTGNNSFRQIALVVANCGVRPRNHYFRLVAKLVPHIMSGDVGKPDGTTSEIAVLLERDGNVMVMNSAGTSRP